MKNHDHPFIVKVIDEFIDTSKFQCIVQNYYDQGDFNKFLYEREGALFDDEEIT
jgi:hypothetical protein